MNSEKQVEAVKRMSDREKLDMILAGYNAYLITEDTEAVRLLRLAVTPSWRRRGVGTRLVNYLIVGKITEMSRRELIVAEVHERNVGAQLWLKGIGFRAEAVVRGLHGEDDGIEMCWWTEMVREAEREEMLPHGHDALDGHHLAPDLGGEAGTA